MTTTGQAFIAALEPMQLTAYFKTASATIWLFDYFLTFRLEVSFVWGSPWSITRILFTLTRYLQFITSLIFIYGRLTPDMSISTCHVLYKVTGWILTIGISTAEVILTIRTWALWGRDRRLTIALPIFFLICWAPAFAIMGIVLSRTHMITRPDVASVRSGCFMPGGDPTVIADWIIFMVYEAVLLALMMIQAVAAYRSGGNSALSTVIFRDGILYYIYLFVFQAIQVVVILALPHDFVNLLGSLECVIHSVLVSRVILHIREQANRNILYDDGLTDNYTLGTDLQFGSFHMASRGGDGMTAFRP